MREAHAAALEQVAFLDEARDAAPALRALPLVAQKGLPVQLGELADDAILQAGEVVLDQALRAEAHGQADDAEDDFVVRGLGEMASARRCLGKLGKWGHGRLRLGASTTACQHLIPPVLREFKEIESIDTGIATEGGKNTARINLKLVPRAERDRSQKKIEEAIRKEVAGIPGVQLTVGFGGAIFSLAMSFVSLQTVLPVFVKKIGGSNVAVGLIPVLWASGPGAEIQKPIAAVVMGGLVSSLYMTLIVLPALYGWFEKEEVEF